MPLRIHQFACLQDNYGYLVRDEATGLIACIDTPDAQVIARELEKLGWGLDHIINTHWHADHTDGNAALKARYGATITGPAEVARVAPLDRTVRPDETVQLGETAFTVIETGGHTLGHVSYHAAAENVAFVGDSLFPLGCGRMFEGDAALTWAGLQRLATLPDETRLYCGHEYTQANARFALSVDDSPQLKARAEAVFAARAKGQPTVPSTMAEEKATNPFLRAPILAGRTGAAGLDGAQAFLAMRRAKDVFKG